MEALRSCWRDLYGGGHGAAFESMCDKITEFQSKVPFKQRNVDWYRDSVVYCLYVDLFASTFEGLGAKLPYLRDLGITCIWMLPVLSSPMLDAGFDIDDYDQVRSSLTLTGQQSTFDEVLAQAAALGIQIVFDIALNHVSSNHTWFRQASASKDSPFRDFFIWSDTKEKYSQARVMFQGIETSNWAPCGEQFYMHRFFSHQPDLNYRNPAVLCAITEVLMRWVVRGVDGFRMDAAPFMWKEDGTDCENLPQVHTILRWHRAVMDLLRPGTILLAEACQPSHGAVAFFGNGDECHAAYHFPLMPKIFSALASANRSPIEHCLSPHVTPAIPPNSQWFTFLRCHDELTFEMLSADERALVYQAFCHKPQWDFRQGLGISARLYDLLEGDERRVRLAFAIMFSIIGTPIVYYGDEVCKTNDEDFYAEQFALTGLPDTRYMCRGRFQWDNVMALLEQPQSHAAIVHATVKQMCYLRAQFKCLGRGTLEFLPAVPHEHTADEAMPAPSTASHLSSVLIFQRTLDSQQVLVVANLANLPVTIMAPARSLPTSDLMNQDVTVTGAGLVLPPFGFHWIDTSADSQALAE
eukprot:TRINITY_DN3946_c0_g1_i1.p1 TRINITY_DN3946_c0_g1~~TRINITY_DN3946_c0_g1_i1.p1  ORF type:complete len:594 (+),score=92.42 TRINITY_DN3946_c0_g1_i1:40-1782(+)